MNDTKKMTMTALFIALGLLLPFVTGQIPEIGGMLLPMHIPVLLCGFVCGWKYGLMAGFIVPLLRSILFGRPYLVPAGVTMAFELATYGAVAGAIFERIRHSKLGVYISLICAMVIGRIVWGVVSISVYRILGNVFTWEIFAVGAFVEAIPGIVLQLIVVPVVVRAIMRANYRE